MVMLDQMMDPKPVTKKHPITQIEAVSFQSLHQILLNKDHLLVLDQNWVASLST